MKKIVILLLLCIVLTGCTIVRIDTTNIDNTISVVLSKDNTLYNQIGKGYKYYIPRGVIYIDTNGFNEKLYSNGNYYYLYIDVVGYYYQTEIDYNINPNSYYSKKININDKQGYLEINKEGDKYLIEFFYNHAKIEAKVNDDDINDVILDASYILSTIKYNNNVISLILDSDFFVNKEENYETFTNKEDSGNFLKAPDEEEYDEYEEYMEVEETEESNIDNEVN